LTRFRVAVLILTLASVFALPVAAHATPTFLSAINISDPGQDGFEPQVVVQASRIVFLNHESPLLRGRHLDVAGWLIGLFEIPFFPVCAQISQRHGQASHPSSALLRDSNRNQNP